MMQLSWVLFSIVITYLLGSIPNGFLIAKYWGGIDIREHGSGNIGATNVKRVLGSKLGYITLVLDCLKGFIPVYIVAKFFPEAIDPNRMMPILTSAAAVLGHSKSIYMKFQGGKSVATSVGVFFAMQPVPALLMVVSAILVIKVTRYVSVGSMFGAILMPILVWYFHGHWNYVILTGIVGVYVIYLHRSNIVRLMKHQENRL